MADFKDKKYDILVATSVVEVGIDVSNATVMVIEGAERYGLAQLHQLRGRVGRGGKQSYCLLFTDSESNPIRDRLTLFVKTVSGNQLAEYDLKIRGPGEIYGQKQHGYLNLKIASLTDYHLISQAKKAVDYFISQKNLSDYPEINQRLTQYQTALISHD
jgi:ATP-dependent DNA helicase RecG